MTREQVHDIEFFRSDAGDDVAVLATIAGAVQPLLVIARATGEACHEALLDETVAAAASAEDRYRDAGLPFAGGALLVRAANLAGHRSLMAAVSASLRGRGLRFLPDGGLGAGDLALLRGTPGPADEVDELARWTALGAFVTIERLVAAQLGKPLAGASVVVQGLGAVGMALCELLDAAGAVLQVADPRRERVRQATLLFHAAPLVPSRVRTAVADVLVPCAPEQPLTAADAVALNVRMIVGTADGQLADDAAAAALRARGICWAPDHLVNAGGAIAASVSMRGLGRAAIEASVRAIADRVAAAMAHSAAPAVAPRLVRA